MITNFTPFTADRSILAGGMALAQGIGGGLQSLGDGISKMLEEKKQKASLATSLRKTLSVAYPDRKDEFATLGLEDLQGTLKGEALKSALAEQQSMRLDEALRQQERRMKIAEALAQQRVPQELQAGFESAGRGIPAPLGNEQFDAEMNTRTGLPPAVRELIAAHAQAGAGLPAAVLDDIIRQGAAGGANEPLRFEEDPVTGSRFGRLGKSVLPSGTNPAKTPKEAEELFDPDGNVIGHRVPIGGGKFTFRPVKPAATGELLPVLDPVTRRPVPGLGMDATGKVHDYRNIMQKSGLGAAAEPVGTQANPHTPKTPAEAAKLKKGEWFTTPDGRIMQRK